MDPTITITITLFNETNRCEKEIVKISSDQLEVLKMDMPYWEAKLSDRWTKNPNEYTCTVRSPRVAAELIKHVVSFADDPELVCMSGDVDEMDTRYIDGTLSYNVRKTSDDKWLYKLDGAVPDSNDHVSRIIPRKVELVFAVESGKELYRADGGSKQKLVYEAQYFSKHDWDFKHTHVYTEDEYAEADASEDDKYSPPPPDSMRWSEWVRMHGQLYVLYRHPLNVATYDVSDIPTSADWSFLFECSKFRPCGWTCLDRDCGCGESDSDDESNCEECRNIIDFENEFANFPLSERDRMFAGLLVQRSDAQQQHKIPESLLPDAISIADEWCAKPHVLANMRR